MKDSKRPQQPLSKAHIYIDGCLVGDLVDFAIAPVDGVVVYTLRVTGSYENLCHFTGLVRAHAEGRETNLEGPHDFSRSDDAEKRRRERWEE